MCTVFQTKVIARTKQFIMTIWWVLWRPPLFLVLFLATRLTKESKFDWFKLSSPLITVVRSPSEVETLFTWLGKTHLSILSGETSLGRLGGGVLLLDVSFKMEIIDFLQPKIKENLCENITLTPEKMCTSYLLRSTFIAIRVNVIWSMFCPGYSDRDHNPVCRKPSNFSFILSNVVHGRYR